MSAGPLDANPPGLGLGKNVDPLQATLLADVTHVVPGQTFHLGVLLKLDPGWYTYWHNPKDGGDPPKIEWRLPKGYTAGSILWPQPQRKVEGEQFVSYSYSKQVLLQVEVTPPKQLTIITEGKPAAIPFSAKVVWQACDETCIWGEDDVQLLLSVANGRQPSKHSSLFETTRATTPQPLPELFGRITTEWQPAPAQDGVVRGGTWRVELIPHSPNTFKLKKVFPFGIKEGTLSEPKIESSVRSASATFTVDGLSKSFKVDQLAALFVITKKRSENPVTSFVIRGAEKQTEPKQTEPQDASPQSGGAERTEQ